MPGAAGTHCSHVVGGRLSRRDGSGRVGRAGSTGESSPFPAEPPVRTVGAMAQLGADDVELDRLATTFDRTASRLTTSEESITSSVQSVTWLGPDADVFRTKWKSGMKSQLATVSQRLTSARPATSGRRPRRSAAPATAPTSRRRRRGSSAPSTTCATGSPSGSPRRSASPSSTSGPTRSAAARSATWPTPARRSSWRGGRASPPSSRHALVRNDPGALFGLEGLPAQVRADARDRLPRLRPRRHPAQQHRGQAGRRAQHRLGPPRRGGLGRHRPARRRHVPRRPQAGRRDRRQHRGQGRQGPGQPRRRRRPELHVRLAGRGRGVRRRPLREAHARPRLVRVRRADGADGRHRRRRRGLPRRPQRRAHEVRGRGPDRGRRRPRARRVRRQGRGQGRRPLRLRQPRDDPVPRRQRLRRAAGAVGRAGRRGRRDGQLQAVGRRRGGGQVRRPGPDQRALVERQVRRRGQRRHRAVLRRHQRQLEGAGVVQPRR